MSTTTHALESNQQRLSITIKKGQTRPPKPPRINVKVRMKRCYELAGKGIYRDGSWTLIHGLAYEWVFGHAWLMKDGWVYDPVADKCFTWEEYQKKFDARIIHSYTQAEVFAQGLRTGHWGPWDDEWHSIEFAARMEKFGDRSCGDTSGGDWTGNTDAQSR